MKIREAILKAADHIERNPGDFNFHATRIPECGTPGCAMGWIAHFLGEPKGKSALQSCEMLMGFNHGMHMGHPLYERMGQLDSRRYEANGWRYDAQQCAIVLRLYADRYHPAERHDLIPSSIRDIFTMTPEQLGREFAKI